MADSTKTDLKQVTAPRRMSMDPALSEDLMERVLTPENLRKAWHQVKANHGAPGVDGMTIEDFPAFAREHWPSIRQAMRDETYQPSPVRRTEIPKRHGQGKRRLGHSDRRRSGNPASDGASAGAALRPGLLGVELWLSARALGPPGRQADTGLHQSGLQGRRGHGPGEILRPGQPRRLDGPRGTESPR